MENKSKYKGVTWVSREQSWQAQLYLNGSRIHIGRYKAGNTKESREAAERKAAIAYDVEAIKQGFPPESLNILKPKIRPAA